MNEVRKSKTWSILKLLMVMGLILFINVGCGGGGDDPAANNGDSVEDPKSGTCTVVVETNKDEATFTVTDSVGKVHTGQGKSATFSGLSTGNLSAGYGPIDTYCTPGFESRAAGAGNTVKFTAEYKQGCDSNIIIETNHAEASFLLIGPETYYGNGTYWEMLGVPDGTYTIIFNDLPEGCYTTPSMQTRTAVAGSVLSLKVNYEVASDCSATGVLWYKDADGDSFSDGTKQVSVERPNESFYRASEIKITSGDCNDDNPEIHPGATDIPNNGIDEDCNGSDFGAIVTWYKDADSDGYGNSSDSTGSATQPSGYVSNNTDCNDGNADIHPDATDIPNNEIDEDCNGSDLVKKSTWYKDADGDGYGSPSDSSDAVTQPSGYVSNNTDCKDNDGNIHPGATEIPDNGIDEDCIGGDLVSKTWYRDADADGYGNLVETTTSATQPAGYVSDKTDCDDTKGNIHPGATDIPDNDVDEDCQGGDQKTLSWYKDSDKDGYGDLNDMYLSVTQPAGYVRNHLDCNDSNGNIHPGATEIEGNDIDENCDGSKTPTITVYSYDFESGENGWWSDNGIWEVGEPTSGPGSAYSPSNCAATVLDGNYPSTPDSRFVSPTINLPNVVDGEEILLRFQQYFNYHNADQGVVQIQTFDGTAWSSWIALKTMISYSSMWHHARVDLTAYAGMLVRIGFYHEDNYEDTSGTWNNYTNPGWYIDDVEIVKQAVPVFSGTYDFDDANNPWGGWFSDRGIWEIGEPTTGPGIAFSGTNCIATKLDSNYPSIPDSRLISPVINLPNVVDGEEILLRFQQYFNYHNADKGMIQIQMIDEEGGWTDWATLETKIGYTTGWYHARIDLTSFAGMTIRIGFYHEDNYEDTSGTWNNYTNPGWYIDDVVILVQ